MQVRLEVRRTVSVLTGLPELTLCRVQEREPDPCVVETAPLARALEEFVRGWRRKRPSTGGQFRETHTDIVEPLGPYQSLAFDTGLAEEEIQRVRSRRYVELRVADSLVAAGVGDTWLFQIPPEQGGLRILPNRHSATPGRGCCGGSLD